MFRLGHDVSPSLLLMFWGIDGILVTQCGFAELEAFRKAEAAKAERQAENELAEITRLEERREDRADKKREQKHDRAFDIFLVVLSFALGTVIKYFFEIVQIFRGFFH